MVLVFFLQKINIYMVLINNTIAIHSIDYYILRYNCITETIFKCIYIILQKTIKCIDNRKNIV